MDLHIEITSQNEAWLTSPPDAQALVQQAITAVLQRYISDTASNMEVSVLLADDETIRELNRTYRGIDKPTNVLAFPGEPSETPANGQPRLLGDIILAHGTVIREAEAQGKTIADHLSHLAVHCALHLLVYDRAEENEAEVMEAAEIAILSEFGISNPYVDRCSEVQGVRS